MGDLGEGARGRGARARGFSMIELMVVTSVASILAGAMGMMYLEARVSGARVEATLSLEREASLVTEWLRRELRGATTLERHSDGLSILRHGAPTIRYTLQGGLLLRDDGAPRAIAADVAHISTSSISARGERVVLSLERALGTRNTARIERNFVAVRLP